MNAPRPPLRWRHYIENTVFSTITLSGKFGFCAPTENSQTPPLTNPVRNCWKQWKEKGVGMCDVSEINLKRHITSSYHKDTLIKHVTKVIIIITVHLERHCNNIYKQHRTTNNTKKEYNQPYKVGQQVGVKRKRHHRFGMLSTLPVCYILGHFLTKVTEWGFYGSAVKATACLSASYRQEFKS